MAESTILATNAGRFIRSNGATFAVARAGSGIISVIDPDGTNPDFLQGVRYDLTASHFLYRAFLFFDLSGIAAGRVLEGDVTLQLYVNIKDLGDATFPNVIVCEGKQSGTIVTGDWSTQNSETENHGEESIDNMTTGQYNTITLDASGKALVQAAFGGTLKLCLMDERDNENNGTTVTRTHGIYYWMTQKGSGFEPKLVFTAHKRVYPSATTTRVTSIVHRYNRGIYMVELGLGEVISDFGIPTVEPVVEKSYEPKKEEPAPAPEPTPDEPEEERPLRPTFPMFPP